MEKIVTSCELRPKIWRWLCVVHKALNCTCYHRNHLWTSFGFVAGLYYQQTALENYSDSVNLVHCLVRLWCRYVQCVWSLYRKDRQWCVFWHADLWISRLVRPEFDCQKVPPNLHKTSGLCNVIFVILTCFHLEKKNPAGCLLKTKRHTDLVVKLKCLVFSSATLFLDGSKLIFLFQKNCLMKAGQNNKYDITKIWSLLQVWVSPI